MVIYAEAKFLLLACHSVARGGKCRWANHLEAHNQSLSL